MKELEKHLNALHRLQKFRRGTATMDELNLTPKEIGEAIDYAIRQLRVKRQYLQGTDELAEKVELRTMFPYNSETIMLVRDFKKEIHNFKIK